MSLRRKMMRTTTCNKCGITTDIRNPRACGWTERVVSETEYVDLCPKCSTEFANVKESAWCAFNATIEAWLGCVSNEST